MMGNKWLFVGLLIWGMLASYALSAKKVICIDGPALDGFLNAHEGYERQWLGDDDVITVGGSLTDCLAQLSDSDHLVIVAHGMNSGAGFKWGGQTYTGFGTGAGKMPLPPNFNQLDNITVDFCSCWSARDPDGAGPDKALVDKLKEALGNNPTVMGFPDYASANVCVHVDKVNNSVTDAEQMAAEDSLFKDLFWINHPPPYGAFGGPSAEEMAQIILDQMFGEGKFIVTIFYKHPFNSETDPDCSGCAENDPDINHGVYTGSCGCNEPDSPCGMTFVMFEDPFYVPSVAFMSPSLIPEGLYNAPTDWFFPHPDPTVGSLIVLNDVRVFNFNPPIDPTPFGFDPFPVESFFDVTFDVELNGDILEEVTGSGMLQAVGQQIDNSDPQGTRYWSLIPSILDITAPLPENLLNLHLNALIPGSEGTVAACNNNDGTFSVDSFFDVYFDIDLDGQIGHACGSSAFILECTAPVPGCSERTAANYSPCSAIDDGSCVGSQWGCTHAGAINYNPSATIDDGSCMLLGCTDSTASNFNVFATHDDGTCDYTIICEGDFNQDGVRNVTDLLIFLGMFGYGC